MATRLQRIGVLTAGGDCQGLNAAIRGITLAAIGRFGLEVVGIEDGFVGLQQGRMRALGRADVIGFIHHGGTLLGTGRGSAQGADSMAEAAALCERNARAAGLDVLFCLGGDGTQRFAHHLAEHAGIGVITLPKTIDNDVRGTERSFGFDTATAIACEAIDRLHSTAHSHHRTMLLEVMGRDAGWLAAASGLAGAADAVLIPEIPYALEAVLAALTSGHRGRHHALAVIAEGAYSREEAARPGFRPRKHAAALRLVDELERLTGIETRLTTLGYVMRGGTPSAADRIFASALAARAVELAVEDVRGVLVAERGGALVPVPLAEVAGPPRTMPLDHPLLATLRATGVCLGE